MSLTAELTYSRPQASVLTTASDRTLLMMGQGGGKTAVMAGIAYHFVAYLPKIVGLIAANTYSQLSDSTMREIFEMWKRIGVLECTRSNPTGSFVFNKQPPRSFKPHGHTFTNNHNKIFFANGAVIMLASLDNYDAIEGRTIGWALLDETSDTKEDAVRTVITARLRQSGIFANPRGRFPYSHQGSVPCNPLYVFTKPGRTEWINDYFKLEDHREQIVASIFSDIDYYDARHGNRHVVIASTYHNAINLPENYIDNRKEDLTDDEIQRLIYGSPFAKAGNEYYGGFDAARHVHRLSFTKGYPLHVTFDFNVNPYMTCQVWQIVPHNDHDEARCLQEYALKAPKNTIEDTCRAFLDDYDHLAAAGVFIYGDSSGKSRTPLKDARNFYDVIKKELASVINARSLRLLKQNPRHNSVGVGTIGRREFMNAAFKGRYGLRIKIDETCKHTIADFESVKEDPNGAKLKTKTVIEGVSCEKYGHMSDAADAFICYNWGKFLKMKTNE